MYLVPPCKFVTRKTACDWKDFTSYHIPISDFESLLISVISNKISGEVKRFKGVALQ